jgi:hypothetical protein
MAGRRPEAKHGDLESVVALGHHPDRGPRMRQERSAVPDARAVSVRVERRPAGLEDYASSFDQATDLVEEACAGFVPPG